MLVRNEEAITLSFRPSLLVWIDDAHGTSIDNPNYRRVLDVAVQCKIPMRELRREQFSNSDIREQFSTFPPPSDGERVLILSIAGRFLEDQISRCCLHANAMGYDTHLLCDAVVAFDESMFQTHLARLIQAGVVPSSLNQLTSFLIAEEEDADVVASLKQSIKFGA